MSELIDELITGYQELIRKIKKTELITDYQDFTTIDTPKTERIKKGIGDIWSNTATCNLCGETIRSKNRHDFVWCKCENIAVDGGSWYSKRIFNGSAESWTDRTELFNDAKKSVDNQNQTE